MTPTLVLLTALAAAGPPELPPQGESIWTVSAGAGIAMDIAHSLSDGGHVFGSIGLAYQVGRHTAIEIEAVPAHLLIGSESDTLWAGGFNLLGHFDLVPGGRDRLVLDLGAGLLAFTDPIPAEGGESLNFTLLAGLSWEHALGKATSFRLGYRYHHVSNGGRGEVNPGINASQVYLGMRFW